jgi:hypothetical protein
MKTIFLSISLMLATVTAFATIQTQSPQDKPWRVFLLSDAQNLTATTHYKDEVYENAGGDFIADDDDGTSENQTWVNYNHFWLDGIGGVGGEYNNWQNDYWDYQGNHYGGAGGMTGNITWDETGYGEEIGVNNDGTTITGFTNSSTVWGRIGNEHCNVSDPVNKTWDNDYSAWDDDNDRGSQHDTYTRTADTIWHVQTGGKAIPGLQNLWQFNGSASEILDKRAVPQFYGANTKAIPYDQIAVGSMGCLGTNGVRYNILPDGIEQDVTPTVAGKDFYSFSVGGQKYFSHFQVFVRQPWPNYPNDDFDNNPIDEGFNPTPPGYPRYKFGGLSAGHAWWELYTDAPIEAVNQFTTTNCSRWLGQAVGYGPIDPSNDWWRFLFLATAARVGTGELSTNNGVSNVSRNYSIGFYGLIGALQHTEQLFQSPGTWDSQWHNCVQETIITGIRAGVQLPNDYDPESFGFDLPPDDQ